MRRDREPEATLKERLASARTPEQGRAILGKRRINAYAAVVHALTLSLTAITAYLAVGVVAGWKGVWVIGWILPLSFLALFVGSISYGDIYWRVNGRRPPRPFAFIRFLDRLNRNI